MADYSDAYGPIDSTPYSVADMTRARKESYDAGYADGYDDGKAAAERREGGAVIPPRCRCGKLIHDGETHIHD